MITSRREKTLLLATIVLLLLLPVYLWLKVMWERWHELDAEAQRLTQKLEGAKELIKRKGEFEKKWRSIEGRVERAKKKGSDARFRTHLWELAEGKSGIHFDELRPRKQEEEDRIIVTFNAEFKSGLDKLTRFLHALDQADHLCPACVLEQKQKPSRRKRDSNRGGDKNVAGKAHGDSLSPNGTRKSNAPVELPKHNCQLLKVTRLTIRTTSRSDLLSINMDIATLLPVDKKGRAKKRPGRAKRGRS